MNISVCDSEALKTSSLGKQAADCVMCQVLWQMCYIQSLPARGEDSSPVLPFRPLDWNLFGAKVRFIGDVTDK